MTDPCPVCRNAPMETFFQMKDIPTQDGVMADSKSEAFNCIKGDLILQFCQQCGYIINRGHVPEKIQFDKYDFSLQYSPKYNQYLHALSDLLISRFGLQNRKILEIGCGTGEFLEIICKQGCNRGIGIDPGFQFETRDPGTEANMTFYREYYLSKHRNINPDFIICRLVIDLLSDPFHLMQIIYKNVRDLPDILLYFEIFDAEFTFSENIVWNIVYEHRSWFTESSVVHFFEANHFEVIEIHKLWSNEYLGVVLKPRLTGEKPAYNVPEKYREILATFKTTCNRILRDAREKMESINHHGIRTIGWGAGARAITFFNLLRDSNIQYIVDINPLRHHKFLPGSGQEIVEPAFIQTYKPDLIIITNPTYADEIKQQVSQMKVESDFWVL
jgi:SAM-dependent methyltransferase